MNKIKQQPTYVASVWFIFFCLVALLYHLQYDLTLDAIYLRGFFDVQIFTTLFCILTATIFILNAAVQYIIKDIFQVSVKHISNVPISILHFISLFTYIFAFFSFKTFYLQHFHRPSLALRAAFHKYWYAYIAVLILCIGLVFWVTTFCKHTLGLKFSKRMTTVLMLITIAIYEYYWMFIDASSNM